MAQSKSYKKVMNFVYGMGAAVVIIGALFKIQHISLDLGIFEISGGLMLTIGLLVEAGVFAVSAFDTPEDDFDWTKVYPELGANGFSSEDRLDADGVLSQKLDNLLKEAQVDTELMTNLGNSIKSFHTAAEGLSVASESISSTAKYNDQVELAATQMESLNGLYQVQMENSNKQSELNNSMIENSERLKEQMESLASNLSSLNGVYGGMLSAMSSK